MLRNLTAALVLIALCGPAGAGRIRDYSVPEPWYGAAYADDLTGEFTHCAASVEYRSDVSMIISITREYVWVLSFVSLDWNLAGEFPAYYRIDGGKWEHATATTLSPNHLLLPVAQTAEAVERFRRGRLMELSFAEGDYQFDLSGTSATTASVGACVGEYLSGEGATTAEVASTPLPSDSPSSAPASSSGTGIIVTSAGHILTNNHVVEGCNILTATRSGDLPEPVTVLRTDPQNDLAVLRSGRSYPEGEPARFRIGSPLRSGDEVSVYGYPLAGLLATTGNIVTGNVTALAGVGDDARFVQISAPVQPGNSGGPLMDMGGNLVGVVNARISDMAVLGATGSVPQNVNFAIRSNVATNFLEAHGVPYSVAQSLDQFSLADVAERARQFTVLLQCD